MTDTQEKKNSINVTTSEAKDFQKATARRIADIFREGKQRRVLLADEVGLGKTVVAKEVVDLVREMKRENFDRIFRVVYVCSNLNIIRQNVRKFGIKTVMPADESRLSMQHLILQEKTNNLQKQIETASADAMQEMIIPLTPETSFHTSNDVGNAPERALIYLFVREDIGDSPQLSEIFRRGVKHWDDHVRRFADRIKKAGKEYMERTLQSLKNQPQYIEIRNKLIEQVEGRESSAHTRWCCVVGLRKVFANVTLEQLDPDLVIMDEFQRFKDLINPDVNSEQGLLIKKFLGDDPETKPLVLLLSATPYKPYTTIEELNETNRDEQYRDFTTLMEFLFEDHPESDFKKVWDDYSTSLSQLDSENFTLLLARKEAAENVVYKAMCRTERNNVSLIDEPLKKKPIPVSEGDIMSYVYAQKVLDDCKDFYNANPGKTRLNSFNVPVEYVKSSPYLLSFMDKYKLKEKILEVYDDNNGGLRGLPGNAGRYCLVSKRSIQRYETVPTNNARLEVLINDIFRNHAELLLWVPASHPYYITSRSNVFEKNRDFSKILVFSSWEMVPRMIACMLSYKAEQLVVKQAIPDAGYKTDKGRQQADREKLLSTPFQYLADIYDPRQYFGWSLSAIRAELQKKIRIRIEETHPEIVYGKVRISERLVRQVAELLNDTDIYCGAPDHDNADNSEEKEFQGVISSRVISLLADMAIGSPAVCLFRRLHNSKANEAAAKFLTIFNRKESYAALRQIFNGKEGRRKSNKGDGKNSEQIPYYEMILKYCVLGNLQAVFDEFIHTLGYDPEHIAADDVETLKEEIKSSVMDATNLHIHTSANFGQKDRRTEEFVIRAHFAVPFQGKSVDNKVMRSNSVRLAFNSPFRPFVLATTSIGQEGLDFHWYCRKIFHWNLPSNPQDLEQREGRINRYECLAIRRNVAKFFGDGVFGWNEMFERCRDELHCRYPNSNDLVPYWCFPSDWVRENEKKLERIDRFVLSYPMSSDIGRYSRLKAILSLYRLTMGQPRQEELLKLIGGKLTDEQIHELLFDFSPSSPKHLGDIHAGGQS